MSDALDMYRQRITKLNPGNSVRSCKSIWRNILVGNRECRFGTKRRKGNSGQREKTREV